MSKHCAHDCCDMICFGSIDSVLLVRKRERVVICDVYEIS